MTCIDVIRQRDAVHVLTDGAGIGPDGRVVMIGPKITIMPHLALVLAVRGAQQIIATLAMLVGNGSSFDEVKTKLPARLHSAFEQHGDRALIEANFGLGAADFDLVVAGISETCGPDSFLICSHGAHGIHPYTIFDPGRALVLPDHQEAPFLVSEFLGDDDAIDKFDPIIGGRALMLRQREIRQAPYGSPQSEPRCEMGGFAQLTTVWGLHRTIETRVIHRWSDELGKAIGARAAA